MPKFEMVNVPHWIRVTEADAPAGSKYWRLSKIEYWNNQRSGGTHHIYTMSPYDASKRIAVSNGQETWEVPLDKPSTEPSSNFPMWAGNYYSAWMTGLPSDKVLGMHMPAKHHVSYLLWWEEAIKEPVDSTTGTIEHIRQVQKNLAECASGAIPTRGHA